MQKNAKLLNAQWNKTPQIRKGQIPKNYKNPKKVCVLFQG